MARPFPIGRVFDRAILRHFPRAVSAPSLRALSTAYPSSLSVPDFVLPESGVTVPHTVSVIGAPTAWGQPLGGVDSAPAALRAAGLRSTITDQGWRLVDRGDAGIPRPSASDPMGPGRYSYAVGRGCASICDLVRAAALDGHFALCLGGDHSVAAGSVSGVLAARGGDVGVLWVDAHADINAPGTSPSGNLHGTPVSFLLRELAMSTAVAPGSPCTPALPPGWEWLASVPALLPTRLAYIGLRDLDPGEKAAVRALGLRAFTMADVDRLGIGAVMEQALDHIAGGPGGGRRPLHLSFDIDAVDPSLAPATGTTVPGGLTLREAHFIAESAAASGLLGSMDMVEVNPAMGGQGGAGADATVRLALGLIASALGRSILPHQHAATGSSGAAAHPRRP